MPNERSHRTDAAAAYGKFFELIRYAAPLLLGLPVLVLGGLCGFVASFDPPSADPFLRGLCGALCVAGFLHGTLRITRRHPACDPDYADWLARTAWRPGLPLPRGELRLSWRDAAAGVVLGVAAYALRPRFEAHGEAWALGPSLLILGGAAIALIVGNLRHVPTWNFRASIVLPIAALALLPAAAALPLLVVGSFLLVRRGTRQALATFPWEPHERNDHTTDLGYPFGTLMTRLPEFRTDRTTAAFWSVVFGLSIYGIGSGLPATDETRAEVAKATLLITAVAAGMLGVFRCSSYASVVCSQMCWGRRRATGWWIVPRHDVIFAVPVACFAVAVGLTYGLLEFAALPPHAASALGMGAALFIALGVGPTVDQLNHTGRHACWQSRSPQQFVQTSA